MTDIYLESDTAGRSTSISTPNTSSATRTRWDRAAQDEAAGTDDIDREQEHS